jgi:hypothetical protein
VKRLSIGLLAVLFAAACGLNAFAQAGGAPPPANFGSPPSGQIPILYNDHHVYSKPDVLKQSRVLAALVKNGTLLIPLRSMFEQMGATVSYDAGTKTVTVGKPGAEVKVTVGKPEVMINGESRPLDVPPMIYQGSVLVPVRVISEGMGAYVQWVPSQQIVVVRYIPPTPPPTPAPTEAPTPPPPPPTPTPAPVPTEYQDIYVAGDYIISPRVYNEFSPGNTGNGSWTARGAFEFNVLHIPWMIEASFERFQYPHNCGMTTATSKPVDLQCFVTVIGGGAATFVPAQTVNDSDFDIRLGGRVINPKIYIGIGYVWRATSYGYPTQNGVGFGIEKLPDLNIALSFYGSFWYYPNVRGTITTGTPLTSFGLAYNMSKYQIGLNYVIAKSPIFLDFGWMGDALNNRTNAPVSSTAQGPFVGLGVRF